jgi:hypothetical protein
MFVDTIGFESYPTGFFVPLTSNPRGGNLVLYKIQDFSRYKVSKIDLYSDDIAMYKISWRREVIGVIIETDLEMRIAFNYVLINPVSSDESQFDDMKIYRRYKDFVLYKSEPNRYMLVAVNKDIQDIFNCKD